MENFEFVVILTVLTDVLSDINIVSKLLQAKDLDLAKSVCELDAVLSKLKKHRQDFRSFLARSIDTARRWSIPTTFKQKRKAAVKFDDDIDPERIFKVKVFHGILDIMILQLESRFTGTKKITSLFRVVNPSSLLELQETEINTEVSRLVEAYPEDLSNALATELVMLKTSMSDKLKGMSSVRQLATCLLVDYKEVAPSFPNICVLLRIFLTIPVTVASAERSFSKLKIIKNYMRTSMSQERLQGLSLLSIEAERARKLDYDQVINDFAALKARKVLFI